MSKEENIETLLKMLKSRLNSFGKVKSIDESGNVIWIDVDTFSERVLIDFLYLSLSEFNMIPLFTFFTFDDNKFVTTFTAILVEGAVINALASRALIERGREFKVTDHGIDFDPPSISELLQTQFATLLQDHFQKLTLIKSSINSF